MAGLTSVLRRGTLAAALVLVGCDAGTPPPDWTSAFVGVWLCEESEGGRANELLTSCGSDCDLNDHNTVGSSRNAVQGSRSCDFETDNDEYLDCDFSGSETTCEEIETAVESGAISYTAWMQREDDSGSPRVMIAQGGFDKYEALELRVQRWYEPNHEIVVSWADGAVNHETQSGVSQVAGEWDHVCLTYADDEDDQLLVYVNGFVKTETEPATLDGGLSLTANGQFSVSDNGSSHNFDGLLDEIGVIDVELTRAECARIGACGIDGSDCSCDGEAWVDKGRVDSSCTGVGEPWACCTGEDVGCIDDLLVTGRCDAVAPYRS